MWEARIESVPFGLRYQILQEESLLSFRELFALLEEDSSFGRWYTETLAAAPFSAFFWEHPPLSVANFDAVAEFVLIESESLAQLEADPAPFEGKFSADAATSVITFPNLGFDALLVVPKPLVESEAYPHLAAFVRSAPRQQTQDLWEAAARCVREHLVADSQWLSTAGLGVSWLHLRLDSRPKYYRYQPYTVEAR